MVAVRGAGALPAAACKRRYTASALAPFCADTMLDGWPLAGTTDPCERHLTDRSDLRRGRLQTAVPLHGGRLARVVLAPRARTFGPSSLQGEGGGRQRRHGWTDLDVPAAGPCLRLCSSLHGSMPAAEVWGGGPQPGGFWPRRPAAGGRLAVLTLIRPACKPSHGADAASPVASRPLSTSTGTARAGCRLCGRRRGARGPA